jgi:hypothetical protein
MTPYRHPELGLFHKLDLSAGGINIHSVSDAELAGLANYLDNAARRQDSRRILDLLQEMLDLNKITAPVWGERIDGPVMVMRKGRGVINPLFRKIAPEKYQLQLEIDKRQSVITNELARYQFRPAVYPQWNNGRWTVTWLIQSKTQRAPKLRRGVMQIDDGAALQLILDFARAGNLDRLRRCLRCNKWLYAKFRHQNFCSASCQQKHYAHSKEWRVKRRDYMRNYRQLTMEGRKK